MMHARQFQRSAALAGSVLFAALGAQAAGSFTVQNGNWVVTSELNGEPGRGMNIDVQDGTLVMQVYNYDIAGQPTFHMSYGAIVANHFSGALRQYKDGRYYGSGPRSAEEYGSAGDVQVNFTSATTGTIQFPGEPAVAISRYNFDNIPAGTLSGPKTTEQWLLAELDDSDKPVNAILLTTTTTGFSPGPMNVPAINTAQSFKDGSGAFTICSYASATQQFTCDIQFDGTPGKRKLVWSKNLESMSGRISATGGCTFSPCPPTSHRVVGMRLGIGDTSSAVKGDWQMDAPSASMSPPIYQPAPDPGNWIITSELDGKPGRGMAIDVQSGKLVMQVYNYETSGASTFHMAVADYAQGKAADSLIRYEGGRYYGGPALIAHAAGDAGPVQVNFTSPTKGTLQFPGEPAVSMQRYQFGDAAAPQPESLFGGWMIFDPGKNQLEYYTLDHVYAGDPTVATGTGALLSIRCNYPGGAAEAVKCTDQTFTSIDDYRFTPVNGRAIGSHDETSTIYVLRVKDRNGVLAGLGKF